MKIDNDHLSTKLGVNLSQPNSAFIILAGGKSSRFNSSSNGKIKDKLLSKRGSITLIEYLILQIKETNMPFYIITRGEDRKKNYLNKLREFREVNNNTIITETFKEPKGPLGGIITAIKSLKNVNTKIFLPADLPYITSTFLLNFKNFIKGSSSEIIGLVHSNGQIEHLLFATKGKNVNSYQEIIDQHNLTRVSSIMRLCSKKEFITLSKNDYKQLLMDSDFFTNEEVKNPTTILSDNFTSKVIVRNMGDPSNIYNQYLKTQNYSLLLEEAEIYLSNGLNSLALHALLNYSNNLKEKVVERQIEELKIFLNTK